MGKRTVLFFILMGLWNFATIGMNMSPERQMFALIVWIAGGGALYVYRTERLRLQAWLKSFIKIYEGKKCPKCGGRLWLVWPRGRETVVCVHHVDGLEEYKLLGSRTCTYRVAVSTLCVAARIYGLGRLADRVREGTNG